MTSPVLISIDKNELRPTKEELLLRLGKDIDMTSPLFCSCESEIREKISPRVAFLRLPIERTDGCLCIGDIKTESTALLKTLDGYSEAVIFAVTLGTDVDRLIRSASLVSKLRGFILDSVASAYAEALCELAEKKIFNALDGVILGKRFSPGYADLPLSVNRELLSLLGSDKNIGIYILDSALMSPRKSVTAIIGVKEK